MEEKKLIQDSKRAAVGKCDLVEVGRKGKNPPEWIPDFLFGQWVNECYWNEEYRVRNRLRAHIIVQIFIYRVKGNRDILKISLREMALPAWS